MATVATASGVKFAQRVFFWAGVYGIVITIPQFFTEARFNASNSPPIDQPIFYYGFFGLVLVWQLFFLMVARQPLRYRPLMILGMLEKASFGIAAPILYSLDRAPFNLFAASLIDIFIGVMFFWAYQKTAAAGAEYDQQHQLS